jgi:predicted aldo/keto reductase-like oxidoreductase
MEYRKLGRTGVNVGVVGLGMEYLEKASEDTVASVVGTALDCGVNYFDLWMATPEVRTAMGRAIKGRRSEAFIAGHLGAVLVNGTTDRSRDVAVAGRNFEDFLTRVGTDHVDAAMLFFVDEPGDFDRVFAPGGTADLALRLKKEGKARFIGMSSHYAPTALRAVRTGLVDILMFPVNPAFDLIAPNLRIESLLESETYAQAAEQKNPAVALKRELYMECARRGVAIVAMKPFAAGWLFRKDNPSAITLTPVQCLHYALSQPGVVAAVPGCKNVEEVKSCLSYVDATNAERDYSAIASNYLWRLQGKCMYCDHCLPCPEEIDVGVVTRFLDAARAGTSAAVREEYGVLDHCADECTACGVCQERCPFGVNVIENMREAGKVFG